MAAITGSWWEVNHSLLIPSFPHFPCKRPYSKLQISLASLFHYVKEKHGRGSCRHSWKVAGHLRKDKFNHVRHILHLENGLPRITSWEPVELFDDWHWYKGHPAQHSRVVEEDHSKIQKGVLGRLNVRECLRTHVLCVHNPTCSGLILYTAENHALSQVSY